MLPRSPAQRRHAYTVLSAPRQVAMAIKREILQGELKPGDRLPSELELADLFGVSRPTIRAGLQELCAARILAVQRGRGGGYRVATFSLETFEASVTEFLSLSLVVETLQRDQFLEVRRALELVSAELAAARRTDESLSELEQVVAGLQAGGLDSRQAFELDLEFHRLLARCTSNPLLQSFEGAMIAVLHHFLGDGAVVAPDLALANIEDIVAAVRAQDGAAARAAMSAHLEHSAAYYAHVAEQDR
jgi:GntR family transcriptional regulator, transcriptional repressor for pyruvate dehydrogenase complex